MQIHSLTVAANYTATVCSGSTPNVVTVAKFNESPKYVPFIYLPTDARYQLISSLRFQWQSWVKWKYFL